MFKRRNFTLLSTKWANLNLMPATSLQKVGTGATKDWKAIHFEKIELGKHLATNYVDWHQVSNMISYKINVLESLSEVNMGWSSPICERVRKKIVEYFKSNVPQRQIAKALPISSYTVHNIIKRFRETGEISLRKGQGPKTFVGCLWSSGPQTTLQHSLAWFCHWHY